jgi:hypothetical protein
VYWQPPEALVEVGDPATRALQEYRYDPDAPLIYLHIWPHEKIEPLSTTLLTQYDKVSIEPLGGTPSGWSNHRNRFGHIAYASEANYRLLSTTQVFKTGEIWGLNHYMLRQRPPHRPFIPVPAFETRLRDSLMKYLTSARSHFGYGPLANVNFGILNVNGFVLLLPNDVGSDRIFENIKVSTTLRADDPNSIEVALAAIFGGVFDAAGKIRR